MFANDEADDVDGQTQLAAYLLRPAEKIAASF